MCENAENDKTDAEKQLEVKEKSSQNAESEKRSYYYDDAHGYEVYNPENEGEEED